MFDLISRNDDIRNEVLSIGIPILLPGGDSLLRSGNIKIPPYRGENELEINTENIEKWTSEGWVSDA